MKIQNIQPIISHAINADFNSSPIDLSQTYAMSAQIIATATLLGTMQLQVSNDPVPVNYNFSNFTPTNWANLGSVVNVSAAGVSLISRLETSYRSARFVWTDTFLRVSSITAVADVAGSLNSKYILASSKTADYYFWFDDGAGVDPAIAGRTGIQVIYADNDSAATIGGLIRTAAASKGWTVTGASSQAILTNAVGGATTAASNGSPSPGFTITNTVPTGSISVNMMALCI